MRDPANRALRAMAMAVVLASTAQAAGDPTAGRSKFTVCAGCHAIPGYTNAYPNYPVPRLGGQHPEYVAAALKGYKLGERQHPTMHANAFTLSPQDMEDIAAFLATARTVEPLSPIRGNALAGKGKSTTCAACHGPEGNSPMPQYPRLDGQHEEYLRKVLGDYQSGVRQNPIMKGMIATLSPQDLDDLAAWFASQPNGLTVVKPD
ncbi:MAG: cytochrome c [Candidatus Contendobacter sp.]